MVALLAVSLVHLSSGAPEPACCFPRHFVSSYEHFADQGGFQANIRYSEDYGVRLDTSLWDPKAVASRAQVYLLKTGHLYEYNVTSGSCVHFECSSCFTPFCTGQNTAFRFAGNVTIGSQNAQKWAVRAGEEFYSEITAVGSRPGQCIPVNELAMSGMYLEADTRYSNSFFYNVRPLSSLDGSFFNPPASCRDVHVTTMTPTTRPQHFPPAFLSLEGQARLLGVL